MSKLSRKIFISVFTLVLTVTALVATTYAWFTLGDTVSVGNVEGSVVAGLGLEMRLVVKNPDFDSDEEVGPTNEKYLFEGDWTSFISAANIESYLASEEAKFTEFSAVTSEDGKFFKKLSLSAGTPSLAYVPAASSDYIKLEFEFRTQSEGNIHLYNFEMSDNGPSSWTNDGAQFKDAKGKTINSYDDTPGTIEEYITNSARVSFFGTGDKTLVLEKDDNKENNIKGAGSVENGAHSFFISRNSHVEEDYGTLFNDLTLVETTSVSESNASENDNGSIVAEISTDEADKIEGNNDITYNTSYLVVYIWVEGWDVNAYNPVFKQQLTVNLNFRLVEPVTP